MACAFLDALLIAATHPIRAQAWKQSAARFATCRRCHPFAWPGRLHNRNVARPLRIRPVCRQVPAIRRAWRLDAFVVCTGVDDNSGIVSSAEYTRNAARVLRHAPGYCALRWTAAIEQQHSPARQRSCPDRATGSWAHCCLPIDEIGLVGGGDGGCICGVCICGCSCAVCIGDVTEV